MLTNTDATLCIREQDPVSKADRWRTVYLPAVWWHTQAQSSVTADGMKNGDAHTVRIPDTDVQVKKGDCIVKGRYTGSMESVKDLRELEHCRVTSVHYSRFGSSPHIRAGGV